VPGHTRIAIFAKAPRPHAVKTRLMASLGAEGAAALHLELLQRTVSVALAAMPGRVDLWCAPDIDHPVFAALTADHGIPLHRQVDGDLGVRMADAIGRTLESADRALLIGSDCPAFDPDYLARAATALDGACDVVLGPCEDGGYALIGMRRLHHAAFVDVPWSTAAVLEVTRTRLAGAGLEWRELDLLWDVDTPTDVERYRAQRGRCGP